VRASAVVLGGGIPFDVELRAGAVVGLAGLEGHGQEEFLRALGGIEAARAGDIVASTAGRDAAIRTRFDAWRNRIVYLPRNRGAHGIFPPLSVLDNFGLPTMARDARLGFVSRRSLLRRFRLARDGMQIRLQSPDIPITSLSGGNQQKVLLGRWLAAQPRVLLLDDPTRGVDLPTKRDLHAILRRAADDGAAVVALSTELEELEELCDEVLVFHEGNLAARLTGALVTRDRIAAAMFGLA
jgi:ribose transport system ATP-binding protein